MRRQGITVPDPEYKRFASAIRTDRQHANSRTAHHGRACLRRHRSRAKPAQCHVARIPATRLSILEAREGPSVEGISSTVANSNHSHLQFFHHPAELVEPCTFVSAIASPTGNLSKQPPSSLPSRRQEILLRSRSRLQIDWARDSDAVRAGNSLSILSSGRRHGRSRSYCPITYRFQLNSTPRWPSGVTFRSSAPLSATTAPLRLRQGDADVSAGRCTLLGAPTAP